MNRTTRSVQVTEIGRAYYDRARALIAEFDSLEDSVKSEAGHPRGRLKITAPQTLGELELMEMLKAFRVRFPKLDLDVFLADRIVDLIGEGYEVALRVTTLMDSTLIARKLCDVRLVLCASPSYLAVAGTPQQPQDLVQHTCIVDTNIRWRDSWRFGDAENGDVVRIEPGLTVNSATAVHRSVHEGMGVGFIPEFAVARDLKAGRLVSLFDDQNPHKLGVYLVYPHRLHLSAKVRAFIDFTADWYTPQPPWLRD